MVSPIFNPMFFAATQVGPVATAASITYTDNDTQTGNTSTWTFTSKSIGTAATSRRIAVGVANERNTGSPSTVTSMTIGGISASVAVAVNNGSEDVEIWTAAVPTGTTATIIVNVSANAAEMGIGVWALYNASGTVTDSGTDTVGNPVTFDLDIAAGGVAVAMICQRSNSDVTYTWAGLTEKFDKAINTNSTYMSGASDAFATTQTNLTVSSTASQAGFRDQVFVTCSFPFAP